MPPRIVIDKSYSAEELVRAIVQPSSKVGVRIPTYPEATPTATTSLVSDVSFNGDPATGIFGLLSRSPIYPLWLGQVPAAKWSYQVSYSTGATGVSTVASTQESITAEMTDFANTYSGNIAAGITNLGIAGSAIAPFNSDNSVRVTAPLAQVQNQISDVPFVYVPKGAMVTQAIWLTGGAAALAMDVGVNLEMEFLLRSSETDQFSSTAWSTGANAAYRSFVATANYWVRPSTVTVTYDSPASGLPFRVYAGLSIAAVAAAPAVAVAAGGAPSLDYAASAISTESLTQPVPGTTGMAAWNFSRRAFSGVVFTGVDMTLENTTKVMNKEGVIFAGVTTDLNSNPWRWLDSTAVVTDTIAALPVQRRYRGAAEHGLRATVPPGRNFATLRTHSFNLLGFETINVPVMYLVPGDTYTLFSVNDPDLSTASQFLCSLTTSWEYASDNQFVETRLPGSSIEALHRAMLLVNTRPPFSSLERGTVLAVTNAAPRRTVPPKLKYQQDKQRKAQKQQRPKPKPKPKAQPSRRRGGVEMFLASKPQTRGHKL